MPASNREQPTGFWQAVSAALAVLARKSGGSFRDNPMPEIREAAREWENTSARAARQRG